MPPKAQDRAPSAGPLVETPPFPTDTVEEKPPFCIDNEGAADWYCSKIAAIDAEIALLQSQHEQRIKRLESDRQALNPLRVSLLEAVPFLFAFCTFQTRRVRLTVSRRTASLRVFFCK